MSTARERLLDAAERCFYQRGVSQSGINTVTACAGVAPMSLYKNFGSKADLIETYLERRHDQWKRLYDRRRAAATTALDVALAVPRSYLDHAKMIGERFRGCGLINAASELQTVPEARALVLRKKSQVQGLIVDDLVDAGASSPQSLAEHVFLLLEGATVHAGFEMGLGRLERAMCYARDTVCLSLPELD